MLPVLSFVNDPVKCFPCDLSGAGTLHIWKCETCEYVQASYPVSDTLRTPQCPSSPSLQLLLSSSRRSEQPWPALWVPASAMREYSTYPGRSHRILIRPVPQRSISTRCVRGRIVRSTPDDTDLVSAAQKHGYKPHHRPPRGNAKMS